MVTQAETGGTGSTLVRLREWLALIGAVVVILGGLLGGMRLVVAPLYTEMQALHGRMDRMEARMQEEFRAVRAEIGGLRGEMGTLRGEMGTLRDEMNLLRQDMNSELKNVRSEIADLGERLTRVETLLERGAEPSAAGDAQP